MLAVTTAMALYLAYVWGSFGVVALARLRRDAGGCIVTCSKARLQLVPVPAAGSAGASVLASPRAAKNFRAAPTVRRAARSTSAFLTSRNEAPRGKNESSSTKVTPHGDSERHFSIDALTS